MSDFIIERATDTAKKIRKRLKEEFPELSARHFSVRSSTYSGGSSVSVSWTDYPTEEEVGKVVNRYQSSHFDSMQDLKVKEGYIDPEDGKRYTGADYITLDQNISDELREKAVSYLEKFYGDFERGMENSPSWYRKFQEVLGYFDKDNNLKEEYKIQGIKEDKDEEKVFKYDKDKFLRDIDNYLDETVNFIIREEPVEVFNLTVLQASLVGELSKKDGGYYFSEIFPSFYKKVYEDRKGVYRNHVKYEVERYSTEEDFTRNIKSIVMQNLIREMNYEIQPYMGYIARQFKESMEELYTKFLKEYHPNNPSLQEFKKKYIDIDYDSYEGVEKVVSKLDFSIPNLEEAIRLYINKLEKSVKGFLDEGEIELREKVEREQGKGNVTEEDVKHLATYLQNKSRESGISVNELKKSFNMKDFVVIKSQNPKSDLHFDYVSLKVEGYIEKNKEKEEGTEDNLYIRKEDLNVFNTEGDKERQDGLKKEKKEYPNRIELGIDVMKNLVEGQVNIEFIKSDGSKRFMRASRNPKFFKENDGLVNSYKELNKKSEIKKEIQKGTISVVDLDLEGGGGARKFVVDRLKTFQPNNEGVIYEVSILKENNSEEAEKHFNPQDLTTQQMIDILNKKVVRLVFKKKDNTLRPMIATRNHKLVDLYLDDTKLGKRSKKPDVNSKQAVKNQIERDYVTVLDLEKGQFRTFKPSRLERYDSDNNISSWIEFVPNNDAWYNIAKNGYNPTDYYQEGKRSAKNIGRDNSERTQYENEKKIKNREDKEAIKTMELAKKNAEKVRNKHDYCKTRRSLVKKIVHEEAERVSEQPITKRFVQIYKESKKLPEMLKRSKAFNNMMNKIHQVKSFDNKYLTAIQVGQDVFYIHPLFVVNAYSGRVYIDRTSEQVLRNIGKVMETDADWGSEDVLDRYTRLIKGQRRSKGEMFHSDEMTKKRMERILSLAKKYDEDFKKKGVTLSDHNFKDPKSGYPVEMLGVSLGKNIKYFIHPDVILKRSGKGLQVLFKSNNPRARGVEFREFFGEMIQGTESEQGKEVINMLMRLVITGLDMRKRV